MFDDFAPKLAKVITEYSAPIRKGDRVTINGTTEGLPLIEALMVAVLKCGGHPVVRLLDPHLLEIFLQEASDEQLRWANPVVRYEAETEDVFLTVDAPANTVLYFGHLLDAERGAAWNAGLRPAGEIYRKRINDNSLRWNGALWPTDALAQLAGMHLVNYREYAYRALGLDQPDPVAYWEAICEKQSRLVVWLQGKKRAEIKGPGIDLSFSFEGRPWANYHGKHHLPDGEIFTCPVEDSVNGYIEYSYSAGSADGVKLTFKDGQVVEASAEKGHDILLKALDTDEGVRRLGLFGIGTNTGLKQATGRLFTDIKMAGTVHTVLGQSMAEGGGVNKSSIQLVMLHDLKEGEIRIDGELFYRAGEFMVK